VAGASAERQAGIITIRGDDFGITLEGSSFNDRAAVSMEAGGGITIDGENFDNQYIGCTGASGGTAGPYYCNPYVKTVTAPLGGGDDTITFQDELKGITVVGAGFGGDDKLVGGPGPQSLDGGKGDDTLAGKGGPDKLRGREGHDRLNGGPGKDDCDDGNEDREVTSCER
jgi:Ca2+-binding RTX toxin-like protein